MKAKLGMVITEASGSLGGHTFQNSKGGFQIRTKPIPPKSGTPAQILIRSFNSQLQAGWRSLTTLQQKIWNDWSVAHGIFNAKGDKHTLSGHSLWMQLNFYNLEAGDPFWHQPWGPDRGTYGPELISNGTFDTAAGWSLGSAWSISASKLNHLINPGNSAMINCIIPSALNYKLEFDISNTIVPARIAIYSDSEGWIFLAPYNNYYLFDPGHINVIVTSFVNATKFGFYGSSFDNAFSLDNLSLKQIL